MLCKKSKCRNAFSRNFAGGRYLSPSAPSYPSKNPDFIGSKEAIKPGRGWHIVAGGPLTPSQMHCATVPDGEIVDGAPAWESGSYQRLEAQNRRLLERHFADLEAEACKRDVAASLNHCLECGREDDLTDRANSTLCYPCFSKRKLLSQLATALHRPDLAIPDDLSIPAFLDRWLRSELRLAA
jgi:hypothetical protein